MEEVPEENKKMKAPFRGGRLNYHLEKIGKPQTYQKPPIVSPEKVSRLYWHQCYETKKPDLVSMKNEHIWQNTGNRGSERISRGKRIGQGERKRLSERISHSERNVLLEPIVEGRMNTSN